MSNDIYFAMMKKNATSHPTVKKTSRYRLIWSCIYTITLARVKPLAIEQAKVN